MERMLERRWETWESGEVWLDGCVRCVACGDCRYGVDIFSRMNAT